MALMDQLPKDVQRKIYSNFLFRNFLDCFQSFFSLPNHQSPHRFSYFTWNDVPYQNFMVFIMQNLEPIKYEPGQIIFYELDCVDTVQFFMQGEIDIGYEVNRQIRYKIRLHCPLILGGFECSFNRRSQQFYKAKNFTSGYMIRKKYYTEIQNEWPGIYVLIKKKNILFYQKYIRTKINILKRQDIKIFEQRADYKQVTCLRADFEDDIDLLHAEIIA